MDYQTTHIIRGTKIGSISPKTSCFKLGNRSALDWIIDQYRIKDIQSLGAFPFSGQELQGLHFKKDLKKN